MTADTGGVFGGGRGAISAGGGRGPTFDGIAEIKNVFGSEGQRGDGAGKGVANGQIARVGEWAAVFQRNTAGRFTEDHQAKASGAAPSKREFAPRRDRRAD